MKAHQVARIAYEATRVYNEEARLPSMLPWWNIPEQDRQAATARVIVFWETGRITVTDAKEHLFAVVVQLLMPPKQYEQPIPKFLSDGEVSDLLARHNADNADTGKPFDPSAPIVVKGPPSDAEPTTTEANRQLMEKNRGEKHEDAAEDVAQGEPAQADRDGRQAADQKGSGADVEKPVKTKHGKKS